MLSSSCDKKYCSEEAAFVTLKPSDFLCAHKSESEDDDLASFKARCVPGTTMPLSGNRFGVMRQLEPARSSLTERAMRAMSS